jgi:dephospho-CoA kinase
MIVIGLTGSIGMGKTTVAAQFAERGAKVCSADAIVHRLLEAGGAAVTEVAKHFPGTAAGNAIDRKLLGDIVFHDQDKMTLLEGILHPLVAKEENDFLDERRREAASVAILEIPLLFETGGEKRCDLTVVTTAPVCVQKKRVLARPGMNEEKFSRIVSKQMPDKEKRKLADFVVQTGLGKAYSSWQVKRILRKLDAA